MTKTFQATKGQKILIGSSAAFSSLFSGTTLWLWKSAAIPLYVGLIWGAIMLFFIGRLVAIARSPVVEICENRLQIIGWFGSKQQFNLSAPLEMASDGYGIVLKQGRVSAGLSRYVIGKNEFDEVVQILGESMGNVGR
jgi:hypothetical protein